jgi:hypothetical protein
LSSPFRRLANVTCRLILFSIRFSSTLPRPIFFLPPSFSLKLCPSLLLSLSSSPGVWPGCSKVERCCVCDRTALEARSSFGAFGEYVPPLSLSRCLAHTSLSLSLPLKYLYLPPDPSTSQ